MSLLLAERRTHYDDIADFIRGDVCSFLMKRLSGHHAVTYQHSIRVALHSMSVGLRLGLLDEQVREPFLRSALLHDIGKLAVPGSVLSQYGALNDQDRKLVQSHSRKGFEMLDGLIRTGQVIPDVVLYHHENLDGSGYPFGKRENELSNLVRLVRVADSFDAMTCARGYSAQKSKEEAFEELYRWSDICFDASIVDCFYEFMMGGESHEIGR